MKRRFQRSDIPYADRLLMQKYDSISQHRTDAAAIALKVACVALNDTEGLGYKRIIRFAKRLQELISEYYEDTDVGDAHLKTRLEQMGFRVENGRMYAIENATTGEPVLIKDADIC